MRILIAHDESTYRSGEMPAKRWMYPELAPFYNKGRGRSLMVSGFLVINQLDYLFSLDENEWNTALSYV
jgi:hypothetical protein